MKKFLIVLAGIFVFMGNTYAHSFNAVFNLNNMKVKTSVAQSPLKVGANDVTIQLIDGSGANIKNAEISVYFFMPSMPAMNYEVKTSADGVKYAAVIKPTMPGKWAADITIKKDGKELKKVKVDFEVR